VSKFDTTCREYGIEASHDDVVLVIERYDSDNDQRLHYDDFKEMMSPQNSKAKRMLQVRPYLRLNGSLKEKFGIQTKLLFKQAIKQLISYEQIHRNTRLRVDKEKLPRLEKKVNKIVRKMKPKQGKNAV
jgi:hypothetical protein